MDSKNVFSKTAKGLREASGASSTLSRGLRAILKEVDGKKTFADLHDKLHKHSDAELKEALEKLEAEGYVRDTAKMSQLAATPAAPAPVAEPAGSFDDLDFTALAAQPAPAKPAVDEDARRQEAEQKARQAAAAKLEAEAKAKREAEEKARQAALAKAKQAAEEKARREAEDKAKREAEARAKQVAEEQARRKAEESAKREAELRKKQEAELKARAAAEEQARRDAEELARRQKEERARREAEEQQRRAAEEKARQEAEALARREAEEKLKREAEARARQEAEEQARLEAEARAKREAEERARREEEERIKREAEEQARREAEVLARKAAEEQARREAEERARLEAEEKLKREAEERARREAEEEARRETEERARCEAEERAQREEEERLRREAEAQARREAEEKARLEAEARARQEAEEQLRREAEEAVRREAEEKTRREAEEQALREAEAKIRREAEERRQREAEERERLAAWVQSKHRAEEKLRLETEEKARREAEDRIKIEAKERAARAEEERLKEALKEKARQEAEEKAELERQARIRKEAEEELRQEAKEKAEREAEAEAARKAAEKASRAASRGRVMWGKLLLLAAVPLVGLLLGAIPFISFDGRIPDLEKAAAEQFGQPVKIGKLRLSLLPRPYWKLDDVSVGNAGQLKVQRINAVVDTGGVFDSGWRYKSVEFVSPVLNDEAVGWLVFGKPQGQSFKFARVSAGNAVFESTEIKLPDFDARVDIGDDGNWRKMVLEFANRDIYVELHPGADRAQFEITASTFLPPFGGTLRLDDFNAKGTFDRKEMRIEEFNGRNFGGAFSGSANLKWAAGWSIDGALKMKQLDTKKLAPALLGGGWLDGKASFVMQAKDANTLFAAPHVEGSFTVGQGEVIGVDLMRQLMNAVDSGKTGFRELNGSFVHDGAVTQVRPLRLDAGILSATGNLEIGADNALRGRFATAYRSDNQQRSGTLSLSGTPQAPKFSR